MDEYTIKHLDNWLNQEFYDEEERDTKRGVILAFVTEYPDLLERMSWWEILGECPTCEHDGCFPVRFCVGCAEAVCIGCWGEHNNDEPPNDHTSAGRPESR